MRSAQNERTTNETSVSVQLNLERFAPSEIATGSRMFDHLLAQWAFHSRSELRLTARSLDGIQHHVVEDTAIVLGQALDAALGDRRGIVRYAEVTIPMDDALVRAVVDFGGRPYARTELPLRAEMIEDLSSALVAHVFSTFAFHARIGVHVDQLAGTDPHHCAEAAFKALARACRIAWSVDVAASLTIASTKGVY